MKRLSGVWILIIITLPTTCISQEIEYYTNPQLRQEYVSICDEWKKAGINAEALGEVIKKFGDFGKRNSENIYSAISLFNIGQIYQWELTSLEEAKKYYKNTIEKIRDYKSKWSAKNDALAAQETGAHCAHNITLMEFKDGNTTASMEALNILIREFPDGGITPTVLGHFRQAAGGNYELAEKLPQICKYVLENYTGKYEKAVYEHALFVYIQLANKDIVKVKDCEELLRNYSLKFANEITAEEKAKYESWINQLRRAKVDSLIKYESIDDLPRTIKR